MIRKNLFLSSEQINWLSTTADTIGITVSEFVRRIIDEEIKRWEPVASSSKSKRREDK